MTAWTAERIRAELRAGRKPFVVHRDGKWHNLRNHEAEMYDGTYEVDDTPYEVRITDNHKRKKPG